MSYDATLKPYDSFNQELEANVHPRDWINPKPSQRYNLVVLGGGTAGLVSAMGAAGLGARVALIEKDLLGGDCLNVGCVPSKALLSAARAAAAVRDASQFGLRLDAGVTVDFAAVMERMRRLRSSISPHDSARRFTEAGVDVYLGRGKFVSHEAVEVEGTRIDFKKAVIATGARAASIPVEGADRVEVLTNETLFSLTTLPSRLVVIGGGPIGCEMAQCFARLGSSVTLVEKTPRLLPRDDPEAAELVQQSMQRDGVEFELSSSLVRFEQNFDGKTAVVRTKDQERRIGADAILIAAGRAPNVEAMGLEAAGVRYDRRKGIEVNDHLQTSNRNIFAAGDVASSYRFTHAADFMARLVIRNALFLGRGKVSDLLVPWATYTSPELAHVGMTAAEASERGEDVSVLTVRMEDVDRAVLDGRPDGWVRVYVAKGSDRILGATVVADHAGDLIGELAVAVRNRIGLKKIADTIHPYPTYAEAIRKLGDQYNRSRLTPRVATWMRRWLAWTR